MVGGLRGENYGEEIVMSILILGSTGMLGQTLMAEAQARNIQAYGAAKEHTEYLCDVSNDQDLSNLIRSLKPSVIINTVAIIDHMLCEKDPGHAYCVNARPASVIASLAQEIGAYVVHISTDHYYCDDGDKKHSEQDPVLLFNEYARTKYIAEVLALTYALTLVVRTNIVGFRYEKERPTFVEWIINSFNNKQPMTLFDDYFTSSIDVYHFSKILFDLIEKKPTGILNISSSDVSSKKDFIESFAVGMKFDVSNVTTGSVKKLQGARRANSLGLDVSRAQTLLGYSFPTKDMVIERLIKEYGRNRML
jgi:dTDP-4-dehydrorhamnose reductase